jgi:hypothetical protein
LEPIWTPCPTTSHAGVPFATVQESADAIIALGFIGGNGTVVSHPGPLKVDRGSVTLHTPNIKTLACLA